MKKVVGIDIIKDFQTFLDEKAIDQKMQSNIYTKKGKNKNDDIVLDKKASGDVEYTDNKTQNERNQRVHTSVLGRFMRVGSLFFAEDREPSNSRGRGKSAQLGGGGVKGACPHQLTVLGKPAAPRNLGLGSKNVYAKCTKFGDEGAIFENFLKIFKKYMQENVFLSHFFENFASGGFFKFASLY